MKLKLLSTVDESMEFWRGTQIRLMNHEDMHPDDEFFDYLLTSLPDYPDHMILVNITNGSHKAGAVYSSKVSIDKKSNNRIVRLQDLKNAFGRDFAYCHLVAS